MNIQIIGHIAAIGQLEKFSTGSSVTILLAEDIDKTNILPIEFLREHIQHTTVVSTGQKVKVYVNITGKTYTGKDGKSKHLAILHGLKIERLTVDVVSTEAIEENK